MFYIIGALFAIAIGVVLIVGLMGGGQQASAGAQAAAALNEINQIRAGTKSLGQISNYFGIDNDVLEEGGMMPPEIIAGAIGAGNDLDVWGGGVSVAPVGSANQCVEIEFDLVPQPVCIELASMLSSNCSISSGAVWLDGRWYGTPDQALDPATAAAQCKGMSHCGSCRGNHGNGLGNWPANDIQWWFND